MKSALTAFAILLPALTFAQMNVGGADRLSLSLSPEYPRPGSTITVSPQSSLIDLSNTTMTASVNGKQIYSGATRSTTVSLLPIGQKTTIKVAVMGGGQTYTQTVSLSPGDVSLVVEPMSSSPALYAGKPLTPDGGNVRLVAIADFRTSPLARIDPDTLSYTWSVDRKKLIDASGVGKNSVVIQSPLPYRDQEVSVVVQSRNGSIVGGDSLKLTPQRATLRLYVTDPLQGTLFDHALTGSYTITGSELALMVAPYSTSLSQGSPAFEWFLDGAAIQKGSAITLRPEGQGAGQASLKVTATKSGRMLLDTSASLSVVFGEADTNLFGL